MRKRLISHAAALLAAALLCACSGYPSGSGQTTAGSTPAEQAVSSSQQESKTAESSSPAAPASAEEINPETAAYCVVNGNIPYFYDSELTCEPYQIYSELDSLGRCGAAMAVIGRETMPEEERGKIGMVKPSGWHTVKYNDLIEGNYLYNRCHLIGYQLSGENANERNLITGTRYLNVSGMLPFEDHVAEYIKETGNHVVYRVTPKFFKDDLLAEGVLIEACSAEDKGAGLRFCVYCYNIQPGITIDYRTGGSKVFDGTPLTVPEETASAADTSSVPATEETPAETKTEYIVNIGTKRFHTPDCPSIEDIKEKNKRTVTATRDELIENGYSPCGRCCP